MILRFKFVLLVVYIIKSTPYNVASSSPIQSNCCALNKWAYDHISEVRQLADRLRILYNNISRGNSPNTYGGFVPWKDDVISITGKSASELDSLSRSWGEKLISDMRSGKINYNIISQPNFFEFRAAEILQQYSKFMSEINVRETLIDAGHFPPLDLTDFDEVKNYAYPAEVKVLNGKTYIVHKNCTEASKTIGEGTFASPLISVLKRNRTITQDKGNNYVSGNVFIQPGRTTSSTTVTRKTNIYDWVNSNMEPGVVGYNPTINIGSEWTSNNMNYRGTQKPIEIGSYRPDSTVSELSYNKTVISNSDGTDFVQGSEIRRKWVDGRLVHNEIRPFGDRTMSRDEAWKREERERLFWILTNETITTKVLEEWQRQQEERLLGLAQRFHISIEQIEDWHYQEFDRFKKLFNQYYIESSNSWKNKEQGRIDWLIHQNSLTRQELERWQQENEDKLKQLARSYMVSLNELKSWQIEELNRLYIFFQEQNTSMIPSDSLKTNAEQERLDALIREHNKTISQLQNSIHSDQRRLDEIRMNYHGNVQDTEKWLKSELARLGGIIKEQRNELTRITEWQNSERQRLENLLKIHSGSIGKLEDQMNSDNRYIQSLASKYHVSIEELEKWQKTELDRLQIENQNQMETNVKAWQAKEHENLMLIIKRNDLSIEDFKSKIINDRAKLEELARVYKIQVSDVEDWFKQELKNFQNQGLLREVEKEMAAWQEKERDRLLKIVLENNFSIEDLERKIKIDQNQLYSLANTYQIRVDELEEWLKKEFLRMQSEGLIKVENLKDWQLKERDSIMKLVQQNKLTIEEFEQKMFKDRERLQQLSSNYNVQRSEFEAWIREEGKRLQQLGLLQMQEKLSQWQIIERERLLSLINQNKFTLEELESRISNDRNHLYSLAHQHQVRVEEIEDWIKQEIIKLQEDGLLEMAKLKNWQTEWRGNLTRMVQERDFTVEEFHKWLLNDRARLQALAKTHNVQIEEIEEWVKNEEQRFVSLGLLKPNEKLTNWQEVERMYLERITQEHHYRSTEQLEQRLRQDRELLEQLAHQYSVQVEEIQMWMKKELARLRDEGQLQIDNLTSWQLAERERLEDLTKAKRQWNLKDLEATLQKDREHMQKLAFQYHTSIEEIEKWLKSEIQRLQQQGKIEIKNLTTWQQAEQNRIMNLLRNQSTITAVEFERKVQQDYEFLKNLANEYHVNVIDVESYVKNVIEELRQMGKFEMENLQTWQLVERDYIKQFISQYNHEISTAELEKKLRADRSHVQQLAAQYRISVDKIEKWMLEELKRLKNSSENEMKQLTNWQTQELQRLKELIHNNQQLNYVTYEIELMKERARLKKLAEEYSLTVEQIEAWLRQQLLNLKTSGRIEGESLTKWQTDEQNRLIEILLQQQQENFNIIEFETQLQQNQTRLQQQAQEYSISVEQIEHWMRDELQRLQNSGLIQVQHLNVWQQAEKVKLEEWLKQLQYNVSYTEVLEFLRRDERQLEDIAREYQITVEEVESWISLEAARLQFLNTLKQPDQYVQKNENSLWKGQAMVRIQGLTKAHPMTWQEFEKYLEIEKMSWPQLSSEYNISIEEIEKWVRESAFELKAKGLIEENSDYKESWQIAEQAYIQSLINEALRANHQQWSIEELELWLTSDLQRLYKISEEFHVSVAAIESWYKNELQRLLRNKKIVEKNEFVNDWEKYERERIYNFVLRQPLHKRTLKSIEKLLLENEDNLDKLASNYLVTKQKVISFIIYELNRLESFGIINEKWKQGWQQEERRRLRTLASKLIITEQEVLDFITEDINFQQQLGRHYGCSLDQLAPIQRIEINKMTKENLFETRNLLFLQQWQKKARDQIYNFIKNQNLTLKNLRDLQQRDDYIPNIAARYDISATTLKNWQVEEFERLIKLADIYRMSLYQLQNFRESELLSLRYIIHEELISLEEYEAWDQSEKKRLQILQRDTELSDTDLNKWRRKLYLRCQGLVPLDFEVGGQITGPVSTNVTALPQLNISKDRGDQPPHVYEESFESPEPGLEGQDRPYPSVPAQLVEEKTTTTLKPIVYKPPSPTGIQGGYRYMKHEYKLTSSPMTVATASASADNYSSLASSSVRGNMPIPRFDSHPQERRNSQQNDRQQQHVKDFGRQQQKMETGYYSSGSDGTENGQQQEQVEDFGQQHQIIEDFGQQQQQLEDLDKQMQQFEPFYQHQQQVEKKQYPRRNSEGQTLKSISSAGVKSATLVTQPENNGFWSNLKKKTSDLLG